MNKVLIVDGDIGIREPLQMLFQSFGLKVTTSIAAGECLHKFHEFSPDLILVDITEANFDKALKPLIDLAKQHERCKITGTYEDLSGDEEHVTQAKALGVHVILKKPIGIQELLPQIDHLIKL